MNVFKKILILFVAMCAFVSKSRAEQDTIPFSFELGGGFWTMVSNCGSQNRIRDIERLGLYISYTDWFDLGIGVHRRVSEKRYLKYSKFNQDFRYLYGAMFVDARFRVFKAPRIDFKVDLAFAHNKVLGMEYMLDGVLKESWNWRSDTPVSYNFTELSIGPYLDYALGQRIHLYSLLSLTKTIVPWRGTGRPGVREDEIQVDSWYVSLLLGINLHFDKAVKKTLKSQWRRKGFAIARPTFVIIHTQSAMV